MPVYQCLDCVSAVNVDRHGSAYLSAFDDPFIVEQVADSLAVLVDEQLRDAPAGRDTYHEEPAIARFKGAGETSGDSADFAVVKGGLSWSYNLLLLQRFDFFSKFLIYFFL